MATPVWLHFDPTSGELNDTINVSADAHTGRKQRTYAGTVQGQGVTGASTINITQEPKANFVKFTQSQVSATKNGGQVNITGTSNSSKLNFTMLSGGDMTVTVSPTYTAAGKSTSNNTAIEGDPGATAEYSFTITVTVPENTTVDTRTATLKVEATGTTGDDPMTVTAQVNIVQAAGDAYLWLNTENTTTATVTIPQAGTPAQAVNVLSNVSWTVS